VIRKLRAFQELGHIAICLNRDFPGMIGDPSGKSTTRPQLTREEINANAETYKQQIFKLLDPEKTVIDFNSRWMDTLGSAGFLRLAGHVTVRQILERDDFQQRLEANRPLALHEVMYPLVMAYDSVALEADVELGGTDQKFNLLMGRNLQREYGQESQVAMITPLLEGTDGVQKMSKSLGNYIGINEPPQEIFGKIMSITDDLMWRYYELCTDLSVAEIAALRNADRNPRDIKADLAKHIVADFYSEAEARKAEEGFNAMFRNKQAPEDIEERTLSSASWKLPKLLVELGLVPSMAEARRVIEQGGVYVDGERRTQSDFEIGISADHSVLVQMGKRKFVRVRGI
jgi:tyrosyl-tRNA synthetase